MERRRIPNLWNNCERMAATEQRDRAILQSGDIQGTQRLLKAGKPLAFVSLVSGRRVVGV